MFDQYRQKAYPYRYAVTLRVRNLAGGVPSNPDVAEGWLRTKLGERSDAEIARLVAETMAARGVDENAAVEEVNRLRHLNGFKRDENGLYVEGRQVKAMIKEAASIAAAAKKLPLKSWGETRKGLLGFVAEHIFIPEERIYLGGGGVMKPSRIVQKFVSTWRGTGIQFEEVVDEVEIGFTVLADYEFGEEQWAMLWLTAEQNGLGASRSQGFGRFTIVKWEPLT